MGGGEGSALLSGPVRTTCAKRGDPEAAGWGWHHPGPPSHGALVGTGPPGSGRWGLGGWLVAACVLGRVASSQSVARQPLKPRHTACPVKASGLPRSGLHTADFPGGIELCRIILEARAFPQLCEQEWRGGSRLLGRSPCLRGVGVASGEPAAGALSSVHVGSLPIAFFELISKAQSNRADDQRGLLRKEDLVLPEFLRLPPGTAPPHPAAAKGFGRTPASGSGRETPRPPEPWGPAQGHSESPASSPSSADSPPLSTPTSPAPHVQEGGVQTVEGEHVADLTLTGEGDISSPNSTLLPPPPTPKDSAGPPRPGTSGVGPPAPL